MKELNNKSKSRVHQDLDGLHVDVDSFGEVTKTLPIDRINQFLNKHVQDRKLEEHKASSEK